jgi:predicted XRE-type DNA-binding protein
VVVALDLVLVVVQDPPVVAMDQDPSVASMVRDPSVVVVIFLLKHKEEAVELQSVQESVQEILDVIEQSCMDQARVIAVLQKIQADKKIVESVPQFH